MREQEVSHLGFPGAETPKHRTLNTLYYFGISQVGISGLASARELALGYSGYRNTETPNLYALSHFGISQVGISGLASARELALGYSGYRNTETPNLYALSNFGNSQTGFSGYATTGGLAPGFPGSRNSEIPNSKHAPLFRGFLHRDFRDFGVGFSRLANTWGPHLGTPGAEIPKYNNFSTLYLFGISQVGISGLASTRELALGYSGCRNTEISGFSYTLSFRDFACRDFGTCEYKGTRPWVFRIPKLRNTNS
jgi:hypothetical protein